MGADPLDAVGILIAETDGQWEALGSCFLFRSDVLALTAAHCVPSDESIPLAVHLPRVGGPSLPVQRVERHPRADIAMLFCRGEDTRSLQGYPAIAFWDGVHPHGLGETFHAFGYPTEGPTEDATQAPVPRMFIGHFQRFMNYESPDGTYRYLAGELSIPAPGGLSGGPLYRPEASQMVLGVVTANLDSYAVTDSVTTVDDGGTHYREESRQIIRYGLAVMLPAVADWLNERSPKYEHGFTLRQMDGGVGP